MPKILMVDDDVELCDAVSQSLGSVGFLVDQANQTEEAWDLLRGFDYDLILLDWVIPPSTGIEFLKEIRDSGLETPVIMLTAMSTVVNKTSGLESGADDYLTKPFHAQELIARIKAILRRPKALQTNSITLSGITLDMGAKTIRCGSQDVVVTRQEYLLLEFLMRNPDRVFSQEALVERAWSSLSESSSDTVKVHMFRLRKKLHQFMDECPITTVRGHGYKFLANGP